MKYLMLDLETLGKGNNALVTTISAVQFDLSTGKIGAEIELGLDWEEEIEKGAEIDISTFRWWLNQNKEAQERMINTPTFAVKTALIQFANFIVKNFKDLNNVRLYGNGATFDNVIIRNLYQRHGIEFILPYWCDKDVRTLVDITGINPRDYEFEGVKHRGVDDCKHQIKYCCDGYSKFRSVVS